jgi:mono/diheme cytochrome c family protein
MPSMRPVDRRLAGAAAALALIWAGVSVVRAAEPQAGAAAPGVQRPSAPLSGEAIYRSACLACHGEDGRGQPASVVGFDAPLPDFTDCMFATSEPDADWYAVAHEGGPVRALTRYMPAFGAALSSDEMSAALGHIRTFCTDPAWPRGDLNLPRAFFTEKAFPENEAVWSTAFLTGDADAVSHTLVYERRFGPRTQVEVKAPFDFQPGPDGGRSRGLGDVAVGLKRVLHADHERGSIAAAGMELILPTGDEHDGLGNGFAVYEPFAMWGQILPRNWFVQVHGGLEIPADSEAGTTEGFVRTGIGLTIAGDRGFGRAWSPQVEVLFARPEGGSAEWDVVPQIQVTLSKLQHVMIAGGVRVPITDRQERSTQVLVYLLWDWFDGSPFDFWK